MSTSLMIFPTKSRKCKATMDVDYANNIPDRLLNFMVQSIEVWNDWSFTESNASAIALWINHLCWTNNLPHRAIVAGFGNRLNVYNMHKPPVDVFEVIIQEPGSTTSNCVFVLEPVNDIDSLQLCDVSF